MKAPVWRTRSAAVAAIALWAAAANAAAPSVKERLKAHVRSLDSVKTGEYVASLSQLRAQRKEAAVAARELYRESAKSDYVGRWGVVMTLAELETGDAVPALREIALEALPEAPAPDPQDPHAWSPLADEFSIRLRALNGLGRLAATRNPAAAAALHECTRSTNRGMRASAVYEILEATRRSGGNVASARASLTSQLATSDAWMLNMRTGDLAKDGGVVLPAETKKDDGLTTPGVRR